MKRETFFGGTRSYAIGTTTAVSLPPTTAPNAKRVLVFSHTGSSLTVTLPYAGVRSGYPESEVRLQKVTDWPLWVLVNQGASSITVKTSRGSTLFTLGVAEMAEIGLRRDDTSLGWVGVWHYRKGTAQVAV